MNGERLILVEVKIYNQRTLELFMERIFLGMDEPGIHVCAVKELNI